MSTPIIIKANGLTIPATLNETLAAKDFLKRLPFKVSGYKTTIDYCCHAANGRYDPTETQVGWKNGDISLGGGWFSILFGGENNSESYRNMMIIAHIDEKHLSMVKSLPANVKMIVELNT